MVPLLNEILRTRFGFPVFRPHQEEVCRAVVSGEDALVVMPTGAGKSLCYQLPGLARGGPTLVISPLIALIEDQVQHLRSRGMKAERIHSGRPREESRETFRAYLKSELEFLFIAPERLAVPGFAEALKRTPPSLIAVDEAHCISHWGHDFRPDYRLLGERIQGLAGTPMIALTATATPLVQDDICTQLGLRAPRRFIHGFRRDNLAVRAVETLPSERMDRIADVLASRERLPAIVYAPTRKKAEELARGLKMKAAAYHAGMPAPERDRVQQAFLEDKIQVIVATVAFGMGIDKPDVRTVIHAALPGSLEGYYQEIGRAGRDGLPSEALLLHSFSDRKTHEFFLERDYPDVQMLAKIHKAVPEGKILLTSDLLEKSGADPEIYEKALEKLWMNGGLAIDPEGNVARGKNERWRQSYEKLRAHRVGQLDSMQAFTTGAPCRMLALVRHFGDPGDSGSECGLCDRCAPPAARTLDERERGVAAQILASLAGRDGQAAGRLFDEAAEALAPYGTLSRSGFESVVTAMARAGLIDVSQDRFERDGQTIAFRRICLLARGRSARAGDLLAIETDGTPLSLEKKGKSKRKPRERERARVSVEADPARASGDPSAPSELPRLFEELRAWRLGEARKRGVPAFRILSDRVLLEICEALPASEDALLGVRGIGPKLVRQYGAELLTRIAAAATAI